MVIIPLNITVPANQYVVASGELLNAGEVYSKEKNKLWEQAKNSDKTVMISSRICPWKEQCVRF